MDPKNVDYLVNYGIALLRAASIKDDWSWLSSLLTYLKIDNTLGLLLKTGEYFQRALEMDNKICDEILSASAEARNYAPSIPILCVVSSSSPLFSKRFAELLDISSVTFSPTYLVSDSNLFETAMIAAPTVLPKLKVAGNFFFCLMCKEFDYMSIQWWRYCCCNRKNCRASFC
jgi:hypothetical protein